MSKSKPQLILVYNAESGILNAVMHALHKQFKPSTYPCSLCALTYGAVSMHSRWRKFLDWQPSEVVIHHSDDFAEAYPEISVPLPVIMIGETGESPSVLVAADELDAMTSLDDLIGEVEERLTRSYARI